MNVQRPFPIDTLQATVSRVTDELLEVQFKPDVRVTLEGVQEVILAKRQLCTHGRPDVLVLLPAEVELDLNVVTADHHLLFGDCENTGRLAFVTQSNFNLRLAEIHYKYHPRLNGSAVFMDEEVARDWLANIQAVPLQ